MHELGFRHQEGVGYRSFLGIRQEEGDYVDDDCGGPDRGDDILKQQSGSFSTINKREREKGKIKKKLKKKN